MFSPCGLKTREPNRFDIPANFVAMAANSKSVGQYNDASVFDMIAGSHTRLKYCCVGKLPLVKISNHHWQLGLRGKTAICSVHPISMARSRKRPHFVGL